MMNNKDIKPLFIFSLPRAGSTLLQRMLATNEKISSAAEPWVLLPFFYSIRKKGIYTEYSHIDAFQALNDFMEELPSGKDDYLKSVNLAAMQLYRKVSSDTAKYFLDKTPRYHLICDEIIQAFPNGKFIFLWRNPLSVIASFIETWGEGNWIVFKHKVDLFDGINSMTESYIKHRNNILSIKYEDLVESMESNMLDVYNYLDLEVIDGKHEGFSNVNFSGMMGDPTGVKNYKKISQEPLEKWKKTLCNPLRKAWCRRYLKMIGPDKLETMGYDLNVLIKEINAIPFCSRKIFSDICMMAFGVFFCMFEPNIMRDKLRSFSSKDKIKRHS